MLDDGVEGSFRTDTDLSFTTDLGSSGERPRLAAALLAFEAGLVSASRAAVLEVALPN